MLTLGAYPYLLWCVMLVALAALGLGACPRCQRRSMVISGLLSVPFAFTSVLFVPDYWIPVRVAGLVVGIEDLAFSGATGMIAWLCAIWTVRRRLQLSRRPRGGRYVAVVAGGLAAGACLHALGLRVMPSALVTIAATGLALVALRPETRRLAAGGIGFVAIYTLVITGIFVWFPHIAGHWTAPHLWGWRVFGVPLEELAFAAAFGSVWPIYMGYVFEVRIGPHPSQAPAFWPRGRNASAPL